MHLETKDWMGFATGALALLGGAFAAIRYFVKKEQLEGDTQRLQTKYDSLETSYRDLKQELEAATGAGKTALALKYDLDALLDQAMRKLQATASSILVPVPGQTVTDLVFLCALGPKGPTVRRTTVPAHTGIAGYVFQHGEHYFAADTRNDRTFFKGVDVVSSYTTKDLLCVPICRDKNILGVMQFLNKAGGAFNEQNLKDAQQFADSLGPSLARFLEDDKNFDLLGIAKPEEAADATILFCDLTASSMLFDLMNFDAAVKRINAYVEMNCDIALRRGATIDKILGDGVMIRFNVPRGIPDSRLEAIRAALEMRDAFDRQKAKWLSDGMPVSALFTRIGLASGSVRQTILGHPQYQSLTVVGIPVILASNLCTGAPRDRNIVLATAETVRNLESQVSAKPVPGHVLKKIKGQQTAVVELLRCASATRGIPIY